VAEVHSHELTGPRVEHETLRWAAAASPAVAVCAGDSDGAALEEDIGDLGESCSRQADVLGNLASGQRAMLAKYPKDAVFVSLANECMHSSGLEHTATIWSVIYSVNSPT
jgi:hypothetical protein